jgi:vacuolar-type H+-ATPase subunit F/Vma7
MTPVLIGDASDALGFALAGVQSYICDSRSQVEAAIARVTGQVPDPVILLSHSAAEWISDRCEAWRRKGSGPMFVVIPGARAMTE